MSKDTSKNKLTFGEHLDELRKVLIRISFAVMSLMILVFCFKESVFNLLLAPCQSDFLTFAFLRKVMEKFGLDANLFPGNVELITTDISSQFMAHLSVSFYLGILLSSPYILYELMKYVSPALYDTEKKYAYRILVGVYGLFFLGMFVSYWILFPVSSRFLSSYSVSPDVKALISLDSYLSLFISLTVLMGIVFQLPIIAFSLAKMGIIDHSMMATYRRHAFILIVVVAAIITPPDILTLLIVAFPLYLLYELSIIGVRLLHKRQYKILKTTS